MSKSITFKSLKSGQFFRREGILFIKLNPASARNVTKINSRHSFSDGLRIFVGRAIEASDVETLQSTVQRIFGQKGANNDRYRTATRLLATMRQEFMAQEYRIRKDLAYDAETPFFGSSTPSIRITPTKITDKEFHYMEYINGKSVGEDYWLIKDAPQRLANVAVKMSTSEFLTLAHNSHMMTKSYGGSILKALSTRFRLSLHNCDPQGKKYDQPQFFFSDCHA